jgi:hypothetical protein
VALIAGAAYAQNLNQQGYAYNTSSNRQVPHPEVQREPTMYMDTEVLIAKESADPILLAPHKTAILIEWECAAE